MFKRLTIAFVALTCLLAGTASAVVLQPLQSRADQSFASLVPSVSSSDSSFYFNELTCRNNPMEGVDPYGLWNIWNIATWGVANGGDVSFWHSLNPIDETAAWGATGEGARGGASIAVNTFTFGGSDKIGLTESAQYQGSEYTASRVAATVSREAAITAATMGTAQIARGGVESARAMTYSGRAVNYIAQSRKAVKAARVVSQATAVWDVGSGSFSVGVGVNKVAEGDKWGYLDMLSGGMRMTGGFLGARELTKPLPVEGGRMRDMPTKAGYQRHHTPANAVNGLPYSEGPAVLLDTPAHRDTASWGGGAAKDAYRAMQESLIERGRFNDAVRADILDIRSISGQKYNLGINQMLDYVETLD